MDSSWIPVTNIKEFHSSRDVNNLEVNIVNNTLPFLTIHDDTSQENNHEEQSCNEDSSKILMDGRWYWTHDFLATSGVNDRPIYMVLCS